MKEDSFRQSVIPGDPHSTLLSLCGNWEGTCLTWFEPDILADESPIRGTIRPFLNGRFVQLEYEGRLMDEAMQGMVTFGYYKARLRFEAAWINNLHMGTGILFSTGEAVQGGISVLGYYPDPSGGPDWGWRTELIIHDDDNFTLTAYNITPTGMEAKATQAEYRRING